MFIQIFQVLKEITGKIGKDIEDVNITYFLTTTKKPSRPNNKTKPLS